MELDGFVKDTLETKLDEFALALEGSVLEILSVVDEMEVTAGELKDKLVEDDTPLLVELEVNEVAEDGLELSEDGEDGLEGMLKELVPIVGWLFAELVEGSNVLEEVEPILVLKIEVLESTELDELLLELEVALIDTGAD